MELFFAPRLDSEHFCFFLALDLMIPESAREIVNGRLQRGEDTYDIAYRLRIPQSLVGFYHKSRYQFFAMALSR